jgi:hypothetical protein
MNRRGFGRLCAGLVVATLGTESYSARAADLPQVDESGAQAQALGYRHDAAQVDRAKFANFVEGSMCANCQLFQGAGADWGPCAIFPGVAVAAKGWCSAYAKKT